MYLLMQEAHAEKLSEIQGEKKNIEWGSQIRSYVLHPYSMVKDNRSGYESNDPKKILDGDLDDLKICKTIHSQRPLSALTA